jgi:hypothetical protein
MLKYYGNDTVLDVKADVFFLHSPLLPILFVLKHTYYAYILHL